MNVLEVEFVIPDTAEELFALIGDPAEEPLQPFTLLLFGADGRPLGKAPIGIYSVPTIVGQVIESAWPAVFPGPLEPFTSWELRTHKDALIADAEERLAPVLFKGDRMECSATLTGRAGPHPKRRWWRRAHEA